MSARNAAAPAGARPGGPAGPVEHIVVVGAGAAGHAAAERLREGGFTRRLSIVGDEVHRPYNRTTLSKQLLTDELTVADLALPAFTDLAADWHLGQAAVALDTAEHVLTLAGGRQLRYDALVLAPGVAARTPPQAPLHARHVHVLRTLDDAAGIDSSLGHARDRVLVIGGGFIACELASTARARGLEATIVATSDVLLHRGLGATLGRCAADIHRRHGVDVRLRTTVASWEPHDHGVAVTLSNGERIEADTAIVGIGITPRLDWLAGSGLETTDGILATSTCHAVRAATASSPARALDDVVVAGDVARWPNLRFDEVPRRVQHWINAIEMGQAAADNLLSGPDAATPFTPLPRFWSEQHGVKIQSVGAPELGSTLTIVRGSLQDHQFLAAFTRPGPRGDTVTGLIAFDAPRALLEHAALVGRAVRLPEHAAPLAA